MVKDVRQRLQVKIGFRLDAAPDVDIAADVSCLSLNQYLIKNEQVAPESDLQAGVPAGKLFLVAALAVAGTRPAQVTDI